MFRSHFIVIFLPFISYFIVNNLRNSTLLHFMASKNKILFDRILIVSFIDRHVVNSEAIIYILV